MTRLEQLFHEGGSLVAIYPKVYVIRASACDLAVRPPGQLFERFVNFNVTIILRTR